MKPGRFLALLALTLMLAMSFVACGSDSEDAEPQDVESASTTEASTKSKDGGASQAAEVQDEESDNAESAHDGSDESDGESDDDESEDDAASDDDESEDDAASDDDTGSGASNKKNLSEDEDDSGEDEGSSRGDSSEAIAWDPWDIQSMEDEFYGVDTAGGQVRSLIDKYEVHLPSWVEIADGKLLEVALDSSLSFDHKVDDRVQIMLQVEGRDAKSIVESYAEDAAQDPGLDVSESTTTDEDSTIYQLAAKDDYGRPGEDGWSDDVRFSVGETSDGDVLVRIESISTSFDERDLGALTEIASPLGAVPYELERVKGSVGISSFGGGPIVMVSAEYTLPEGETSAAAAPQVQTALEGAGWTVETREAPEPEHAALDGAQAKYGDIDVLIFFHEDSPGTIDVSYANS
ncbi:MAG: hypothetical protein H6512_13355 [Acidimicrobiia bacterium]|nr:hypothetical protein [Acidimicrobiia bacterium]